MVMDSGKVLNDSRVLDKALVLQNATVKNNAIAKENAWVAGISILSEKAVASGYSQLRMGTVSGNATIKDFAIIDGGNFISGGVTVEGFEFLTEAEFNDNRTLKGPIPKLSNFKEITMITDSLIKGFIDKSSVSTEKKGGKFKISLSNKNTDNEISLVPYTKLIELIKKTKADPNYYLSHPQAKQRGCQIRGTLYSVDLELAGFKAAKIFIESEAFYRRVLEARGKKASGMIGIIDNNKPLKWTFHTAPVVFTNIQGRIELVAIDLLLSNKPLPLFDWLKRIVDESPKKSKARFFLTHRYVKDPNYKDVPELDHYELPNRKTITDISLVRKSLTDYLGKMFK